MLLFKTKKSHLLSAIALCLGSLLSESTVALAQLRLGRGIEPGLEGHLIEYQIQQKPLSKMRSVDSCSVGVGVGCNKTASILQKIVTESSGKTYQDILLQAAGGQDNYSRFTTYYPQNVNIDHMPLNSFWRDGGEYVLDSHQHSGIGNLNEVATLEFYQAVRQFQYAPVANNQNSLNLRQGLIALKTAYGKTLIEEARKIPNIEQKIAASGLTQEEVNFHLQQFVNGVEAVASGNQQQLNQSLYELLSNPYTSEPGVLNRPPLGIADSLDQKIGVGLTADEYMASVVGGESSETVIFGSPDVSFVAESGSGNTINTPLYVAMGLGGIAVLALLLDSSDGGSGSNVAAISSAFDTSENSGNSDDSNDSQDESDNTQEDSNFSPEIVIKNPIPESPTPSTSVPESSSTLQFIVLMILSGLFVAKKSYS